MFILFVVHETLKNFQFIVCQDCGMSLWSFGEWLSFWILNKLTEIYKRASTLSSGLDNLSSFSKESIDI